MMGTDKRPPIPGPYPLPTPVICPTCQEHMRVHCGSSGCTWVRCPDHKINVDRNTGRWSVEMEETI